MGLPVLKTGALVPCENSCGDPMFFVVGQCSAEDFRDLVDDYQTCSHEPWSLDELAEIEPQAAWLRIVEVQPDHQHIYDDWQLKKAAEGEDGAFEATVWWGP